MSNKYKTFDEEDTIPDGAEFVPVTPEDEAPVRTLPTNPPPVVPEESLSAKLKKKRAHGSEKSHGSTETHQTAVPVRTPDKTWFFRAHHSPEMQVPVDTIILTGKDDGVFFLSPDVEFPDELDEFITPVLLTRCITHDGTEFFYLAKQSDKAPKESSRRCVNEARSNWIRQRWNASAKAYQFERARQLRREPVWSNKTLDELLDLAFGDKFITNASHEVVNRLLHPDDFDYAAEPTE